MVGFRHVATISGAGYLSNIADLEIAEVEGRILLYSASRADGGLSALDIGASDLSVSLVASLAYGDLSTGIRDPQIGVMTLPTGRWLTMANAGGSLFPLSIDATGAPTTAPPPATSSQIGANTSAVGQFSLPDGDYVFVAQTGALGFGTYRIGDDGGLSLASTAVMPLEWRLPYASIDRIIAVDCMGQKVLVSLSGLGNFIATHQVGRGGALLKGEYLGAGDTTGFDLPRDVVSVTMNGRSYLVVSSAGSSSLTTIRLAPDGQMTPIDHILDEGATRFQRATALEAVMLDGRAYVFAGGADDGISMFIMQPDGRLLHLDTIADDFGSSLADVSDIEAQIVDGRIVLYVSSSTEAGITQLTVDPGPTGLTGIMGAVEAMGTAGNDLMLAGSRTTWMGGGDGNDTLVAGGASVALLGGRGADTFVPANMNGRVAIKDFEVGIDRLDLSQLGMVRSIYQLSYEAQSYGAKLRFHKTVIDIYTKDGQSLPWSFFDNTMFPITHYQPVQMDRVLVGTIRNDVIRGPEGGAQIFGRAGHDLLFGGALEDRIIGDEGNDTLSGGHGDDTLSGGLGADRLRGGSGNDLLSGGNHNDVLFGDAGEDLLFGDAGDDRLMGDLGHDTLRGGWGDDFLAGGYGNDLLIGEWGDDKMSGQWGNDTLLGGLGNNSMSGEDGDDLIVGSHGRDTCYGGNGNDSILGGNNADLLYGQAGHDTLEGGEGDDRLFGGEGDDRMVGGVGNDSLHGGPGNDNLFGQLGNDTLIGDLGDDRLMGAGGEDHLSGGDGHDTLLGGAGRDTLLGGAGDDVLWGEDDADLLAGEDGADSLWGGAGADTLEGGAGADVLDGGAGDDSLSGGEGYDRLTGGLGRDSLTGGAGRDIFTWGAAAESAQGMEDWILDFTQGEDQIDVTALHLQFIGSDAVSGPGQLRAEIIGAETWLTADLDADGAIDLAIRLQGALAITTADLLL